MPREAITAPTTATRRPSVTSEIVWPARRFTLTAIRAEGCDAGSATAYGAPSMHSSTTRAPELSCLTVVIDGLLPSGAGGGDVAERRPEIRMGVVLGGREL